MIHGINPYTISSIQMTKFMRWGRHPSWLKLMRKRHPIKAVFGFYTRDLFDGYYPALVYIYGAEGRILKRIECRSNDQAKNLCRELNDQLADFVKKSC